MGKVYENSPLIEALCEFQFEPAQTWDWTIPGLFYARVQDEFPDRQEHQTIQVGIGTEQPIAPQMTHIAQMQFLRKDRSALVQVGPNMLAINHLAPYPTWEPFRDMIFRHLDLYLEIGKPKNISRLNLRYINKLELPIPTGDEDLNIGDYMLAVPGVPADLLREPMGEFIQRVVIPLSQMDAMLILQSGSLTFEREGYYTFLLDLSVVNTTPLSFQHVRAWVTKAHTEVESAFEACISDKARKLFGEKNNG